MDANPHFETASSWEAARTLVSFIPRVPTHTAGLSLESLRVHVRDHKLRELSMEQRTLEAHYGAFVLSQQQPGIPEARRQVLDVSYGGHPVEARVAGFEARTYAPGPPPPADDIDPRSPAVVVWHDRDMFYLIASDQMAAEELVKIAMSVYA